MKILNIVCTAKIKKFNSIDYKVLTKSYMDKKSRNFFSTSHTLKSYDPCYTLLLYKTGNIVITGIRSMKSAKKSADDIRKRLKKNGLMSKVVMSSLKIRNITAKHTLKGPINYTKLASFSKDILYEPGFFSAAIHNIDGDKKHALIYHTGNVIITGAKTFLDVNSYKNCVENIIKASHQ